MTGHLILSNTKIMTKTFMKRMMNLFEIQKVRNTVKFGIFLWLPVLNEYKNTDFFLLMNHSF